MQSNHTIFHIGGVSEGRASTGKPWANGADRQSTRSADASQRRGRPRGSSRLARAGLAFGFMLTLSGLFTSSTQAASAAQPLYPGISPRTDGSTIVYQTVAGPGGSDVVAVNVADHHQFPIVAGDGQALAPDIDSGVAVWVQEGLNGSLDIRGRNVRRDCCSPWLTVAPTRRLPRSRVRTSLT